MNFRLFTFLDSRRSFRAVFLLAFFSCWLIATGSSFAQAEEVLSSAGAQPSSVSTPTWKVDEGQFSGKAAVLRMMGGLFVCFAVLLGGTKLYRKVSGVTPMTSKKRLKLVERIAIGQKSAVALVSVDGQEFLVGMGSEPPTIIAPLIKNDSAEFLRELDRESEMRVAM